MRHLSYVLGCACECGIDISNSPAPIRSLAEIATKVCAYVCVRVRVQATQEREGLVH